MLKHYARAVLLPALLAEILTALFLCIDYENYQSEWFAAADIIWMMLVFSAIFSLIVCVSALPIFLSGLRIVKHFVFLQILCWFLLPSVLFLLSLWHWRMSIQAQDTFWIYCTIAVVPFLVSLPWTFYQFRQQHKNLIT